MDSSAFSIDAKLAGKTLAAAVKQFAALSWSQAQRLIATRKAKVNGVTCIDEARRLKTGDQVEILRQSAPRSNMSIQIVFQDEHLIVCEKAPGVQTLRRPEESGWTEKKKSLNQSLDELLSKQLGRKMYLVHRLDRDTSGLMLFALTLAAQTALIGKFKKHQIRRTYLAAAIGKIDRPQTIKTHIARDRGDGFRGSVPWKHAGAQLAITHIKPIQYFGDQYTLLECTLETGRTHQIRIHLSEIGHPLSGEKMYTRDMNDSNPAPRQALHSHHLQFLHPITRENVSFTSPLAPDIQRWLDRSNP